MSMLRLLWTRPRLAARLRFASAQPAVRSCAAAWWRAPPGSLALPIARPARRTATTAASAADGAAGPAPHDAVAPATVAVEEAVPAAGPLPGPKAANTEAQCGAAGDDARAPRADDSGGVAAASGRPDEIQLTEIESRLRELLLDALAFHGREGVTLRVAGGWVRNKLLGLQSDDIDIATDGLSGEELARMIQRYQVARGMRPSDFGVIRANPDQSKHLQTVTIRLFDEVDVDINQLRSETYASGSRIPSVTAATPQEDAHRRDFTVNALFYNLHSRCVEDFTGRGRRDLAVGLLRTPLNPAVTLKEDPLRVLRGVRFLATYNFHLDARFLAVATDPAVHRALEDKVSGERLGIEVAKMFGTTGFLRAARTLRRLGLEDCLLGTDAAGRLRASRFALPLVHASCGLHAVRLAKQRTRRPTTSQQEGQLGSGAEETGPEEGGEEERALGSTQDWSKASNRNNNDNHSNNNTTRKAPRLGQPGSLNPTVELAEPLAAYLLPAQRLYGPVLGAAVAAGNADNGSGRPHRAAHPVNTAAGAAAPAGDGEAATTCADTARDLAELLAAAARLREATWALDVLRDPACAAAALALDDAAVTAAHDFDSALSRLAKGAEEALDEAVHRRLKLPRKLQRRVARLQTAALVMLALGVAPTLPRPGAATTAAATTDDDDDADADAAPSSSVAAVTPRPQPRGGSNGGALAAAHAACAFPDAAVVGLWLHWAQAEEWEPALRLAATLDAAAGCAGGQLTPPHVRAVARAAAAAAKGAADSGVARVALAPPCVGGKELMRAGVAGGPQIGVLRAACKVVELAAVSAEAVGAAAGAEAAAPAAAVGRGTRSGLADAPELAEPGIAKARVLEWVAFRSAAQQRLP